MSPRMVVDGEVQSEAAQVEVKAQAEVEATGRMLLAQGVFLGLERKHCETWK